MSDPQTPREAGSGGETWFGWARWRVLMLAGSLILLAQAVANAMLEPNLPGWATTAATIGGYVLLIVGFALAMRARRKS